jgi:hypothetical protein
MMASQLVAGEDVKRDDQKGPDPDRKIDNVGHANISIRRAPMSSQFVESLVRCRFTPWSGSPRSIARVAQQAISDFVLQNLVEMAYRIECSSARLQ